jgi:hypothetical protein
MTIAAKDFSAGWANAFTTRGITWHTGTMMSGIIAGEMTVAGTRAKMIAAANTGVITAKRALLPLQLSA